MAHLICCLPLIASLCLFYSPYGWKVGKPPRTAIDSRGAAHIPVANSSFKSDAAKTVERAISRAKRQVDMTTTLFIFDFDDTLVPTGIIGQHYADYLEATRAANEKAKRELPTEIERLRAQITPLKQLDWILSDGQTRARIQRLLRDEKIKLVLESALAKGTLVIITNAGSGWFYGLFGLLTESKKVLQKAIVLDTPSLLLDDVPHRERKSLVFPLFVESYLRMSADRAITCISFGDDPADELAVRSLERISMVEAVTSIKLIPSPRPIQLEYELVAMTNILTEGVGPGYYELANDNGGHGEYKARQKSNAAGRR